MALFVHLPINATRRDAHPWFGRSSRPENRERTRARNLRTSPDSSGRCTRWSMSRGTVFPATGSGTAPLVLRQATQEPRRPASPGLPPPAACLHKLTFLPIADESFSAASVYVNASGPVITYVLPSCPEPVRTATATAAMSRTSTGLTAESRLAA